MHDTGALSAVRPVRCRRAHLRVHLDSVPGALRRPRCLRPDHRAGDLPRWDVGGGHGGEPVLGAAPRSPARLRPDRARRRPHRPGVPRPLPVVHQLRLRLHLSLARRLAPAGGGQVVHRKRAHPPPVGAARRHVSAHERGRAAPAAGAHGPVALRSLFRQQPGGRRRRAGGRLLSRGTRRASRHAAGGRDAQSRRRSRHLRHRRRSSPRQAGRGDAHTRRRGSHPGGSGAAGDRRARPPAPLHQLRDRGRILHLRDRLDPDAGPGAGRSHPRLRAHALRVHPGPGAGLALDPLADRSHPQPGAHPRRGAVGHGPDGGRDAADLRGVLRLDRHPDEHLRAYRPWLRRVHRRALRPLPRDHASGHLLRRHDTAAHHPYPAPLRLGRGGDRTGVRLEHAGLDRGCRGGRDDPASAHRGEGDAGGRRRDRHGDRRSPGLARHRPAHGLRLPGHRAAQAGRRPGGRHRRGQRAGDRPSAAGRTGARQRGVSPRHDPEAGRLGDGVLPRRPHGDGVRLPGDGHRPGHALHQREA